MRPAGEIRQAMVKAAADLAYVEDGRRRGATLLELAHHAKVGAIAARNTVKNLTRSGVLVRVAERQVDYRNKPVAEYAPGEERSEETADLGDDIARVMSLWVRR